MKSATSTDIAEVATTETQRELLRHMVGVVSNVKKRDWGYRNHFNSTPGSDDDKAMQALADLGLVVPGARGASNYWHCTVPGCEAAGLNKRQIQRAIHGI